MHQWKLRLEYSYGKRCKEKKKDEMLFRTLRLLHHKKIWSLQKFPNNCHESISFIHCEISVEMCTIVGRFEHWIFNDQNMAFCGILFYFISACFVNSRRDYPLLRQLYIDHIKIGMMIFWEIKENETNHNIKRSATPPHCANKSVQESL